MARCSTNFAGSGFHASRGSVAEAFVERGHFVGKTGNHISGKLHKERLFYLETTSLRAMLEPMAGLVREFQPTVLFAPECTGALVARHVGQLIGVSALGLAKQERRLRLPQITDGVDLARPLLIEDNVITGNGLREALETLHEADIAPVGAVVLFESGDYEVTADIPVQTVYNLGIQSWTPEVCECRLPGQPTST